MKKSASVGLTLAAAFAFTAHAKERPDPCAAATFNEHGCQMAVQSGGYCYNDRWVGRKYSQPYPYYYDSYQQFVQGGGTADAVPVGTCGAPWYWGFGHRRMGFGATGSGRHAHG